MSLIKVINDYWLSAADCATLTCTHEHKNTHACPGVLHTHTSHMYTHNTHMHRLYKLIEFDKQPAQHFVLILQIMNLELREGKTPT